MDKNFCKKVRLLELENIIELFSKNKKILEIGAGAGWQAKYISEFGCKVEAIDIQTNTYSKDSVWPVTIYNGKNLPFEDDYFDIIFSSNVLEHINSLDEFQYEIRRVLKPDGIAIHVLPTAAWRICTSMTHHISILKHLFIILFQNKSISNKTFQSTNNRNLLHILKKSIWPERHGERGNSITEIYYFSSSWWKNHFEKTGWEIIKINPNNLLYTGNTLFSDKLNFNIRKKLSSFFGSATATYIVK